MQTKQTLNKNGFVYEILNDTPYDFELIATRSPESIHIKGIPLAFAYLPKFNYSGNAEILNIYNNYIKSYGIVEIDLDNIAARQNTVFQLNIPNTNYTLFYALNSSLSIDEKNKNSNLYTICFGIVNNFVYNSQNQSNARLLDVLYKTFEMAPMSIMSFDSFDAKVVMKLQLI